LYKYQVSTGQKDVLCCGDTLEMWLLLALLAVGRAANIDCKFSLFIIIIIIIMSQHSKQE